MLPLPCFAAAAVLSRDLTRVATPLFASHDGTSGAKVWYTATGKQLNEKHYFSYVVAVAFISDNQKIVTAGRGDELAESPAKYNGQAQIWDIATGRALGTPMIHETTVTAVAFSPDGTRIATASADHTARLWDGMTGRPISEPMKHSESVAAVAFSPDGMTIATGSNDHTVRLWSGSTAKPLGNPLKNDGPVRIVSFSPDGTKIAAGSQDEAIIWDISGEKVLSEPVLCPNLRALAFSRDGVTIATTSWNGPARLWNVATSKLLGEPLQPSDRSIAVAFSMDGTSLMTVTQSSMTGRYWDVPKIIPDDSAWLSAYVKTVSQWREDSEQHFLHPISSEESQSNRCRSAQVNYVETRAGAAMHPVSGVGRTAICMKPWSRNLKAQLVCRRIPLSLAC